MLQKSALNIGYFQKSLLGWYKKNARDLPWRHTRDPYSIWVSEIMLQQTQVKTVIPYYNRWIKKFPTVESLAIASQDEVLKSWAGLGYYRRARMLHDGAKYVVEKFNGTLPSQAEALLKIPGIGKYTAGAIASIAFDQPAPILDGNVIRILTRIFAIRSDTSAAKTLQKLWKISTSLVPKKNPGDFNQAMMELGATICFPSQPDCAHCPVSKKCSAHSMGKETSFPVNSKKEKLSKLHHTALVIKHAGQILMQKQSSKSRWGGLWMFPFWEDSGRMKEETNFDTAKQKPLLKIRHGFTRYLIDLHVHTVSLKNKTPEWINRTNRKWIPLQKLSALALPSPHQKIRREVLRVVN